MKTISQKIRGFSLIETLIAVTILMIAITGPLALVQAGLFSSNHERNQITATYLAQEALEYIRSVRDSNSYKQYNGAPTLPGWLDAPEASRPDGVYSLPILCGTPNSIGSGNNGCYVDPHQQLGVNGAALFVEAANASAIKHLRQVTSSDGINFYTYGFGAAGIDSGFTRTVTIVPVVVGGYTYPGEMTVSVTVTWMDNALPRSYTATENLLNYQIPDTGGVTGLPSGLPPSCGNGMRDNGEECDGNSLLNGASCQSQSSRITPDPHYLSGALKCYSIANAPSSNLACHYDVSSCSTAAPVAVYAAPVVCTGGTIPDGSGGCMTPVPSCPDGTVSDGSGGCVTAPVDPGGGVIPPPPYLGPHCGNGAVQYNLGEMCDGNRYINSVNCQTFGYNTGSLSCTNDCQIDSSGCSNVYVGYCGDGILNGHNEQCDGSVGTLTCSDLTDSNGTPLTGSGLACNNATCQLDTSACTQATTTYYYSNSNPNGGGNTGGGTGGGTYY